MNKKLGYFLEIRVLMLDTYYFLFTTKSNGLFDPAEYYHAWTEVRVRAKLQRTRIP